MDQPAIRVEGLCKEYTLGALGDRGNTFYELLTHAAGAPLRRLRGTAIKAAPSKQFWALRDLNFEVQPGEVIGVIGRNGAGKSTLLKILSRITAPTRGRVELRGRLASLLEVGTGFHPELSGRENIYLNGAILGMSKAEIGRKFDDIVAFAEIEQFLDTPVKRYSSGMYVRLAFAVAANLDADVLVVDEVLAVGDTEFQERCLRKMEDVSKGGRTVLFVSHNLGAISRLCSRAILLRSGGIAFDGTTTGALSAYSSQHGALDESALATGPLTATASVLSFQVNGARHPLGGILRPIEAIEFAIAGRLSAAQRNFRVTVCIHKNDQLVLGLHDAEKPSDMEPCDFESTVSIPSHFLSPGEYSVDVNMYSERSGEWLVVKSIALFSIANEWARHYEPSDAMGIVNLATAGQRRILAESAAASIEPT